MINRLLRAKHWEIFLFTIVFPMLLAVIPILLLLPSVQDGVAPETSTVLGTFVIFVVLVAFGAVGFFGWIWSINMGLQHLIPDHLKKNMLQFKIAFFIPYTYVLLLMLGMIIGPLLLLIDGTEVFILNEDMTLFLLKIAFTFISTFHIISIICIIFCFYFAAKTIKLAELQRDVTFGDFVGEFFMIWFFYIGVWVLQPKLNKLLEEGPQHPLNE
ncbi:MAG: hypothetical protein ACRBF0_06525 [Calditrichia bacterium]